MEYAIPIRRYVLLGFLLALLAASVSHRANWRLVKAEGDEFPEPGSVTVPPGVLALGDLQIAYPPGGWLAVRSKVHPVLEVEGWQAANTEQVSITKTVLLLDGRPVDPISGYRMVRPDIADFYDRVDFFRSGWHVTLPLEHLGPGPHFLALQLTLSNGEVAEIKRVELR